jgi:hypothetical protein
MKPEQTIRNVYAYVVAKWEANEALIFIAIGTLIVAHALYRPNKTQAIPNTESSDTDIEDSGGAESS